MSLLGFFCVKRKAQNDGGEAGFRLSFFRLVSSDDLGLGFRLVLALARAGLQLEKSHQLIRRGVPFARFKVRRLFEEINLSINKCKEIMGLKIF